TGETSSSDFPIVNAKYPNLWGGSDAFVFKLSSNGQNVGYSTYFGGSDSEAGNGIAVDSARNTYVTGTTFSTDFPLVNALYSSLLGGQDVFVFKLSFDGQQVFYSTYLGGNVQESGSAIAIDSLGNAYVAGWTSSGDFPQKGVSNLNCSVGITWLPFISKITSTGKSLSYSVCLGRNFLRSEEGIAHSIAVDGLGNAYITGSTSTSDFPTTTTDPKIISWDADYNGDWDAFLLKFGVSYLEITPNNQDFGLATPGTVIDRIFTVKNTANRTLTGTLATTAPFSIVSGASFTLAEGASQNITVRFAPTQKGFFKAALKATGNFPATSVELQGIAAFAVNHVPVISSAMLQGAPGNAAVVSGRYFGPLPGELRIDGNPVAATEWNDTFIRFTISDLLPGSHTLTVNTVFGEASTPLQVLSVQPVISALLPGNGAVGSTVVIDGYNFGAQQNSSTITVGGIDAPVLFWSDQRLRIKIPALPTGIRYPVQITTATGQAAKTLLVRKLLLVTQYGDCDNGVLAICPPVILSIDKQSADGKTVDIVLENLYNRWYELTVTPTLATIPNALPRFIGPKQKIKISNVAIEPGTNIGFFADATSNDGMFRVALDMLHMVAMGGHLPVTAMDAAVAQFSSVNPDAALAVFFVKLVDNLNNKDISAIIKQMVELPKLAQDPSVQFFLIGYLNISATQLEKLARWGELVHIASVVTDMVEQLLLPRYAASSLEAK
ncbi:MAG: hypothetical protein EPN89_18385, partial [Methylovulum sp.]